MQHMWLGKKAQVEQGLIDAKETYPAQGHTCARTRAFLRKGMPAQGLEQFCLVSVAHCTAASAANVRFATGAKNL